MNIPIQSNLAQTDAGSYLWLWVILFVIIVVVLWLLLNQETKQSKLEADEIQAKYEADENTAAIEEKSVQTASEEEDLTKIEGIGPKISQVLGETGITTYKQLADADVEQLNAMLKEARISISNPATWPEQAALAAQNDWDSLAQLQDELKGGKRE